MRYDELGRSVKRAGAVRRYVLLTGLLLLSLLAGACGAEVPQVAIQISPSAEALPAPTATASVVPVATETPTPIPSATMTPTTVPLQLVILHTNDNWGETEPCG